MLIIIFYNYTIYNIFYNKILFNYQKLLNLNRLKYLIFNGVKKNKMI